MINAHSNYSALLKKFDSEIERTLGVFTWGNAAGKILELI